MARSDTVACGRRRRSPDHKGFHPSLMDVIPHFLETTMTRRGLLTDLING